MGTSCLKDKALGQCSADLSVLLIRAVVVRKERQRDSSLNQTGAYKDNSENMVLRPCKLPECEVGYNNNKKEKGITPLPLAIK